MVSDSALLRGLKFGAYTAVAIVYLMLAGMIETFGERQIVLGWINLGQIVMFVPLIAAGYLAGKRFDGLDNRMLAAAVTGLVAYLPAALLLFFMDAVSMRDVFPNASPALIQFMTLGVEPLPAGAALMLGMGAVAGALGGLMLLMPDDLRRILTLGAAVVVVAALISELIGQVLRQLLGGRPDRALFSADALRPPVAIITFILATALAYARQRWGSRVPTRVPGLGSLSSGRGMWTLRGLGIAVLLALPWMLGTYLSEVLANVGLFMLMALGLNIAVGLAGLFDLGYVTNFAVGAYLVGVLTSTGPQGVGEFNFWLIVPVSIVCAMFTGLLLALPVIRMRGDYLAIATLGFGEMIRLLALSDWFAPLIGGAQGVLFIPKPQIGQIVFQTPQHLFYIILVACILVLWVSQRLDLSRTGRRWMAIREDETVANAIGIDTTWVKTLAFTLSAASGGLSGAIFAAKLGTIFPHSFQLLISINAMCIIIVGGMASLPGIALGSIVLIGMPELLREFAEYRYLFYGVLLILMTIFRPSGLMPAKVRHYSAADMEPDQTPGAAGGPVPTSAPT